MRRAIGEVQKSYSAWLITISAAGNWSTFPVWSQCACVMTTVRTAAWSMPREGSTSAGVYSPVRCRRRPASGANPVSMSVTAPLSSRMSQK